MKLPLGLTFVLTSTIALAGLDIPAQPLTNLKTPTRANASDDADPFDIVQLDHRVLFFARNNTGYGLYVRNIESQNLNQPGPDPVVDLTLRRHTPTKLKQFSKTTGWDATDAYGRRNIAVIDNENVAQFKSARPTEATLFFHVQKMGVFSCKATAGTTKRLLDTDVTADNANLRWTNYLVAHRSGPTEDTRAVYWAGDSARYGVEMFTAGPAEKPKAKLFADLAAGKGDSFPYLVVSSFRDLYFAAYSTATQAYEVYRSSEGGTPGTVTSGLGSYPDWLTPDEGGGIYFTAAPTSGSYRGTVSLRRDQRISQRNLRRRWPL